MDLDHRLPKSAQRGAVRSANADLQQLEIRAADPGVAEITASFTGDVRLDDLVHRPKAGQLSLNEQDSFGAERLHCGHVVTHEQNRPPLRSGNIPHHSEALL